VAVKIIPCRAADLQRVLQEAQTMLRLQHSNVVCALTYAVMTSAQTPPREGYRVSEHEVMCGSRCRSRVASIALISCGEAAVCTNGVSSAFVLWLCRLGAAQALRHAALLLDPPHHQRQQQQLLHLAAVMLHLAG
jgi:hypothetical protein